MPQPTIKQRLESAHFTGHPADVQSRLNSCLASDPYHIVPGSKGEHVRIIQAALRRIRLKATSIPEITDPDGTYGASTAAAVLAYKKLNGIVRTGQPYDDIVGRMTLTRLDDEMKNLGQPKPPLPPVGDFDVVDVIVRYQGVGGAARPLNEFEVFPDTMLRDYRSRTPKRKLVRIGHATVTIRQESAKLIEEHVKTVEAAFQGKTRGGIFIFGSSSGGRNALDLGVKLTAKGLPIVYLATIDAAFFPNEAKNGPSPIKVRGGVPLFGASGTIAAAIKDNFFQLVGNHVRVSSGGLLFTSKMANEEVHGDIQGFKSEDLTKLIESQGVNDDESAHGRLITDATPTVRTRIQKNLDKL